MLYAGSAYNVCRFNIGIQEYEGLTNKIHELQMREQDLQESLICDDVVPEPDEPNYSFLQTMTPQEQHGDMFRWLDADLAMPQVCVTPVISPTGSFGNPTSGPSSPCYPHSSPIKNMVRAYLPNQQTTSVN